ncbi:MAG: DUF4340 domain-containing protein [Saprospiraceae bacterium]|nr:DUF4340 domain-containing protein [Saprospiraceae bacterium]
MNNKTLAITFGVLLLIYLLVKFAGGNRDRSFDPEIMSIDTSLVNKVEVRPSNDEPFTLQKSAGAWTVSVGGKTYEAASQSVQSLLANMISIKADRIVSKNPDKFADYNVNDSLGTFITLYSGTNPLGDLVVGRFSFNQATRNGISYLKHPDKDEVYSVDGFLSMSLSQDYTNYRNKEMLSLAKDALTKIDLNMDGEVYTFSKGASSWRVNNLAVDSSSMATYLSTLGNVSGASFVENPTTEMGSQLGQVAFEGNNILQPIQVLAYAAQDTTQDFILHSSLNEDAYFYSDSSGIYNRVFGKLLDLVDGE